MIEQLPRELLPDPDDDEDDAAWIVAERAEDRAEDQRWARTER